MPKQKFYVVWKGVTPGIYTSWTECQLQIKNYKGALYKSFDTREEAEQALASAAHQYVGAGKEKVKTAVELPGRRCSMQRKPGTDGISGSISPDG